VLEVGVGAGRNLGWYPETVDHIDLCEPDPRRCRRLERRLGAGRWPFTATVHHVGVEGPFPGRDYDVVVATLVMCAAPDPAAAAAAMRAVLSAGGRVCYLEHVRGGGLLGRLQSAMSPGWARMAGGCQLDRPATAALRGAGLVPVGQRWLRLPPPFGLAIEGEAVIRVRPLPQVEAGGPP